MVTEHRKSWEGSGMKVGSQSSALPCSFSRPRGGTYRSIRKRVTRSVQSFYLDAVGLREQEVYDEYASSIHRPLAAHS